MTISQQDLDKIAQLAYLRTDPNQAQQLAKEFTAILDFVEQLRAVDTTGVEPLYHANDQKQNTRSDAITEPSCVQELAAIAPLFADDYYLVPKVLDAGK